MNHRTFQALSEVRELLAGFESCTLPRSQWDHRAHLTVAIWFLMHYDECQATSAVIDGIQCYNRAQGIRRTMKSGYHETLTLFWLAVARSFLATTTNGGSELERINQFVGAYGHQGDLFLDYYSRQRIFSWRARYFWMEPDLRPLDFDQECCPK